MFKLSEASIRSWAGDTIFERGQDYQRQGLVRDLHFDSPTQRIDAAIDGNYGDYHISLVLKTNKLTGDCDCPYDGWPCKHMVAVALAFLANQGLYTKAAAQATQTEARLKAQLQALSAEQLLALVLEAQTKYPEFQRELLLRFESTNPNTLKSIKKDLHKALAKIERGGSISQASRQVQQIWQSASSSPPAIQLQVLMTILDQGLEVLAELGIYDTALDDFIADGLQLLERLFVQHPALAEQKETALALLMYHYSRDNSLEDNIYHTVETLADKPAHYELVLQRLQAQADQAEGFMASYLREKMAHWYARLGNNDAELALLSEDLQDGGDYWRLARYWLTKKQPDKAWQVVKQGLKAAQGNKDELYSYALKQHKGDLPALHKLFDQWLSETAQPASLLIEMSPLYQALSTHYSRHKDQKALEALFLKRLKHQHLDLALYHSAQKKLEPAAFKRFESKLLSRLKKLATQPKPCWQDGLSHAEELLGEIWALQGETAKLWQLVGETDAGRTRFEQTLLPLYPEAYLKGWQQMVTQYIELRNRSAYQEAVKLLKKLQPLMCKQLKAPAGWADYLTQLRQQYPTLRALHDELDKAGF
ncbi:MAG: SWIM zinc finger family protein [Candidatus Sericytochromatia bacterium]|nr:SWIM zinc finger family protein [Candidatus Sericytochromatia bacterium]